MNDGLPTKIVVSLGELDLSNYVKELSFEEASGLRDGMLGRRESITLTGRWSKVHNPYANKEHRDGCLCNYHVARQKRLTGIGILIMTYVNTQGEYIYTNDPTITYEEWCACKDGSIHNFGGDFARSSRLKSIRSFARADFYDALDAVADFLQGVPRG